MKARFMTREDDLQTKFGHLVDGVEHYSKDPLLTEWEQNKTMILLDNAVKNFNSMNGCDMTLEEMAKHLEDRKMEAQTANTNLASFVTTQLPLTRKVFPEMITREIVSIQPMSQPDMKAFYLDIKRGTGDTSTSTDIHNQRDYANNVEYDEDSPTAIKELYMSVTSSSVSATTKKLKYKHTVEAEQDLAAYHGLHLGGELDYSVSSEIVREWDRHILATLLSGATGGSATFDQTIPSGLTYTDRKVWREGLYEKMIDVDTAIFQKRYRKTNYIVLPATLAGFMEKMAGFRADDVDVNLKVIKTGGRYFMGTLNARWRVYCDPFFPSNKILMGYNNPLDWKDTSFVFMPYIMSYFSDVFTNPDTFVRSRAVLSRAGTFLAVPDLLGVVTVTGS